MWWGEPREEGVRCHAVEISPNVSSGAKKGPVHTARFQEDSERERSMDYSPKSFWRSRALKVERPIHESV